jgi:hypothetical protein
MEAYIRMRKKSKEEKENTISRNLTQSLSCQRISDFPFVYTKIGCGAARLFEVN